MCAFECPDTASEGPIRAFTERLLLDLEAQVTTSHADGMVDAEQERSGALLYPFLSSVGQ